MAMVSTQQLVKEYLGQYDLVNVKKIKGAVDNPLIYEYEAKINKQLVDMNADELIGMLKYIQDNTVDKSGAKHCFSYYSLSMLCNRIKNLISFYSFNYKAVNNPFDFDKRLRIDNLLQTLDSENQAITEEQFEFIIQKLRAKLGDYRSDLYELILRLIHSGIENTVDILKIKEEMINFDDKYILFENRILKISDRVIELLKINQEPYKTTGNNKILKALHYNGSYVSLFVAEKKSSKVSSTNSAKNTDRNLKSKLQVVFNEIRKMLKEHKEYGINVEINYKSIYLLGFSEYLKNELGDNFKVIMEGSSLNNQEKIMLKSAIDKYAYNSHKTLSIYISELKKYA